MNACYQRVAGQHPGVEKKFLFHEALQRMQTELTRDLIENTARLAAENRLDTLLDVRAFPERIATFSPGVEAQRREEKMYLHDVLYTCPTLEAEHRKAENVVQTLFDFYMRDPSRMPSGYEEEAATDGLPRIVADYIAGMTDSYILQQFWAASKLMR